MIAVNVDDVGIHVVVGLQNTADHSRGSMGAICPSPFIPFPLIGPPVVLLCAPSLQYARNSRAGAAGTFEAKDDDVNRGLIWGRETPNMDCETKCKVSVSFCIVSLKFGLTIHSASLSARGIARNLFWEV